MEHLQNSNNSDWQPPSFLGGRIDDRKWIVDRLEMRDIWFLMDMKFVGIMQVMDSHEQPRVGRFYIPLVQVNSIGRWKGGVAMQELLDIVTHALINAAIEAVPANLKR